MKKGPIFSLNDAKMFAQYFTLLEANGDPTKTCQDFAPRSVIGHQQPGVEPIDTLQCLFRSGVG
jgi:hypothetical protein